MINLKNYYYFAIIIFSLALTAEAADYKVGITEELPSIEIKHGTKKIEVKRIQDQDNRILDDFSKTSRPCPPFCIHPIKVAKEVETVGEVELLNYVKNSVENGSGLLVDARMPKWHKAETIPGSVNIPFIVFTSSQDRLKKLLFELGVTEANGNLDFDQALELMLYCNGPWCDQSPRAIQALLYLGYPPEKLYYYRGGMQLWKMFGLTTVIPSVIN